MNKYKRFWQITHETYLNFRFLVWYLFIHSYILDFHILEGESMYPTFQPYGDIVIVDKITPRLLGRGYKRGDIVCAINPVNNDINLCKRIHYFEGETVTFKNRNEVDVPPNHIWLEGDNKENSLDSRQFGPISRQMILGRVWIQIWPKFRLL